MAVAGSSACSGRLRRGSILLGTLKGTLSIGGTLGEDTNSESESHEHRGVVKKAEQFNGELYIPIDSSPEELGVDFGTEADTDIRMGSGKAYLDWAFIVEKCDVICIDRDGFVVASITMHSQEVKPAATTWA